VIRLFRGVALMSVSAEWIDETVEMPDLLRVAPQVRPVLDRYGLETFLALGFRPLANPLLRKTVARHVSIGQACRQLGREPGEVVEALNQARAAGPPKFHAADELTGGKQPSPA
jgi:hypothetical protein